MLTSKQRAELRAQANSLEPIFQVGKNGLTPAFLEQLEGALNLRELMKIKILRESSPVDARAAAEEIAAHLQADVVQVIGGIIVLYRVNPELHKPKKKVVQVKKATRAAAKPATRTSAKPAERSPSSPTGHAVVKKAAGVARKPGKSFDDKGGKRFPTRDGRGTGKGSGR